MDLYGCYPHHQMIISLSKFLSYIYIYIYYTNMCIYICLFDWYTTRSSQPGACREPRPCGRVPKVDWKFAGINGWSEARCDNHLIHSHLRR